MKKPPFTLKVIVSLITVPLILVCLILGVLLIISSDTLNDTYLEYDIQDDGSVARAFTVALMENNEDVLRGVVFLGKWSEIDDWLANHEAGDCKFTTGFDSEYINMLLGSGGRLNEPNRASWRYLINCPDYRMEVEDIVLVEMIVNEGTNWQIVSWDVCERQDSEVYFPQNCTAADFGDTGQ